MADVQTIETFLLQDDGTFPNNTTLEVLVYRGAMDTDAHSDPAAQFEQLFSNNGWQNSWRDSIYTFHHYHSVTHEVLGIYAGEATVQLGGPNGLRVAVRAGDVLVLPAGTSHKRISSGEGLGVVGAYPEGRQFDMNYGKKEELPRTDRDIAEVPIPDADPVEGTNGTLVERWTHRKAMRSVKET